MKNALTDTLVKETRFLPVRANTMRFALPPGKYIIEPQTKSSDDLDFLLRVFSEMPVNLKSIQDDDQMKLDVIKEVESIFKPMLESVDQKLNNMSQLISDNHARDQNREENLQQMLMQMVQDVEEYLGINENEAAKKLEDHMQRLEYASYFILGGLFVLIMTIFFGSVLKLVYVIL